MKKIIMIALVAFAFTQGNAQIKTDAGTFTKPVKGTTIVEASLTPDIVGGGIFSLPRINSDLGLVGIKVRRFDSEKRALRMSANLAVLDSGEEGRDTDFAIGLSLGREHHMTGAERLSTYWGYEANVGYVSSTEEAEIWEEWETPVVEQTTRVGVGVNAFTGFDYYVMPKIYLGVEIGYGIALTNTDRENSDSVTRIQLSPSISPSFRLGWQF